MEGRIHFLDNVRSAVILWVLIFHVSITFMVQPPRWWYVCNSEQSVPLALLVLLSDVFMMPVIFFISGYLAPGSLAKHGPAAVFREKLIRLGLPWIFGILVLAPWTVYVRCRTPRSALDYLGFWFSREFWITNYSQANFWFLGVLLVFFAGACLVFRFFRMPPKAESAPRPLGLAAMWLIPAAGYWAATRAYASDDWIIPGHLLVIQPSRIMTYLVYFAGGILAGKRRWFTPAGYQPGWKAWAGLGLVSGIAYAISKITAPHVSILQAGAYSGFCLGTVMCLLAVFRTRWNTTSAGLQHMAKASFGIYYFHMLAVIAVTLWMVRTPLPLYAKWASAILLSLTLAWSVTLLMKRVPGLNRVF